MSLVIQPILDALVSHSLATGYFEQVNTHEPKNSPGSGLTSAIWVQSMGPARGQSGLASTTGLVTFQQRIYTNMLAEPADVIDPGMLTAVDALLVAYSGDFTLGANVKYIDLLGSTGTPLSLVAGYIDIGGKIYRVMTITIPIILNDLWDQVA